MTPPSRGRRRDRVGPNIAHALLIDPPDIRWLVVAVAMVPPTVLVELWDALVRDGHTRDVPSPLYFAHALLQRAIAGVGYEEEPTLSLVLTDPEEASRVFVRAAQEVPGLTSAPTGAGQGPGGGGAARSMLRSRPK